MRCCKSLFFIIILLFSIPCLSQEQESEAGETFVPPNQYQYLKELEWLIGKWTDKDDNVDMESEYKWDKDKNFIIEEFSVKTGEKFDLSGRQIIGWDPIQKNIRSWIFDSDGGFGESKWVKKNDSWVAEMSYTLADGRRASAVQIFTPKGNDQYQFESTDREVDGELLPDITPVTVIRKKG